MRMIKSAIVASCALWSAAAGAQTYSNAPTGGTISSFGYSDSLTYGQVFTAPITGTLTSFTLYLNGGVGALKGGVGTWNGTAAFDYSFGSPTNLYLSSDLPSTSGGAYTFTPNVNVVAGSNYVFYLTAYGVPGAFTTTSMPLGDNSAGIFDYFVWNNTSDPAGNASWNYFFNAGNVQASATFAAGVPEPASWAMMIGGFAFVGGALRRRRYNLKVSLI